MKATAESIVIRECDGMEELKACVQLQKEVWNFSDADLIPLRMFVVAQKIGGQAIGAFDSSAADKPLIGFALSIPGSRSGHPYLHSHMLAVRESYRNMGLGRSMKLAQRDDALARGFELMEWTFDPLEIKNAFLNLERLGAIARRYTINQYGTSSSFLQGGLPTDRLVAEWWLRSERVTRLIDKKLERKPFKAEEIIEVPGKIGAWKTSESERSKAREVQVRNREAFRAAFAHGRAVLGLEREGNGDARYLLGRWDEQLSYASEGNTES